MTPPGVLSTSLDPPPGEVAYGLTGTPGAGIRQVLSGRRHPPGGGGVSGVGRAKVIFSKAFQDKKALKKILAPAAPSHFCILADPPFGGVSGTNFSKSQSVTFKKSVSPPPGGCWRPLSTGLPQCPRCASEAISLPPPGGGLQHLIGAEIERSEPVLIQS